MEQYNWIKAYYITDTLEEKEIFVRQEVKQSGVFVDDEGNRYHISELDLTVPQTFSLEEFEKRNKEINQQYQESQAMYMEMLSKMDANAIADHKAKIDEREYWRKLRGDIALAILKKYHVEPYPHELKETQKTVEQYFNAIYSQDQKFFKDK